MMNFIIIFIGSGLGGLLRYSLSELFRILNLDSLYVTFACNITGSFLIGICFILISGKSNSIINQLLVISFLGGFTTFSTFAFDGILLLERSVYSFILYTIGTLTIGLLMCFVGTRISPYIFSF